MTYSPQVTDNLSHMISSESEVKDKFPLNTMSRLTAMEKSLMSPNNYLLWILSHKNCPKEITVTNAIFYQNFDTRNINAEFLLSVFLYVSE